MSHGIYTIMYKYCFRKLTYSVSLFHTSTDKVIGYLIFAENPVKINLRSFLRLRWPCIDLFLKLWHAYWFKLQVSLYDFIQGYWHENLMYKCKYDFLLNLTEKRMILKYKRNTTLKNEWIFIISLGDFNIRFSSEKISYIFF